MKLKPLFFITICLLFMAGCFLEGCSKDENNSVNSTTVIEDCTCKHDHRCKRRHCKEYKITRDVDSSSIDSLEAILKNLEMIPDGSTVDSVTVKLEEVYYETND